MKFSAREDVDLSIEDVFAALTDVDRFERAGLRRGMTVRRHKGPEAPGVGMSWDVEFDYRGRRRAVRLKIDRFDRPTQVAITAVSHHIQGLFQLDLLRLARERTRVAIQLEIRPQTIPARLFLQTLRLTKGRLNARFKKRFAEFAKTLSVSHQGS